MKRMKSFAVLGLVFFLCLSGCSGKAQPEAGAQGQDVQETPQAGSSADANAGPVCYHCNDRPYGRILYLLSGI